MANEFFYENIRVQIFKTNLNFLFLPNKILKFMDFEHEGIYEELVKRFEKMVQNDAFEFFDTEEYQDIVVYYIEKDNLFMAKKALDYALHQYPMELDILVIQAEIFIVEGKFDTALELLNQLEQKDDKHYEVLYQKGVAYSRKGKHRQAIDYFFRASSQTIEKDEAFINVGIEYIFLQEYPHAMEYFQKALKYQPLEMVALQNLLFCYEVQNLHQAGIDFLNEFIDKYPYNDWAWQQLGKFYFNINEFEKSAEASDMAIVINPKSLHAYLEKASALERAKKYKDAVETYLVFTELFKPTSYVYSRLGYCYLELGKTTLSKEYFEKALELDPKFELVLLYLVEIYIATGDFQLAKESIEKVIAIDPSNAVYWKKRGFICIETKDLDQACESFGKAIDRGENSVEVHLLYAQFLLFLDRADEAIEVLKNIEEKAPAVAYVYFIAGYYDLGQIDLALEYLYKLMERDPEEIVVLYDRFPEIWQKEEVQKIIFPK